MMALRLVAGATVFVMTIGLSVALAEEPPAAPATETAVTEAPAPQEAPALQEVESTSIKEVGYNPETQVLTVVFEKSGETYEYKGVPKDVYDALMAAESKGQYFAQNIKGKFEFTKK